MTGVQTCALPIYAITAIEDWLVDNDAADTENLFEEIQQEMVDSGFFRNKILKYIENLETAVEYMKAQEDSEALQIEVTEKLIGKMKSALS